MSITFWYIGKVELKASHICRPSSDNKVSSLNNRIFIYETVVSNKNYKSHSSRFKMYYTQLFLL